VIHIARDLSEIPIAHPGRRVSDDEMQARGFADIQDPDAQLPTHCALCGEQASHRNPLMLDPIDPSPRMLARAYLYRSRCARCREQRRR
jgi:hypothetical protein